jgi:hypothetical protein
MELYHGSLWTVRKPNLKRGRSSTDFGKGFYTTTRRAQAERWASNKKKDKEEGVTAIVNTFEVRDDILTHAGYRVLTFDKPNREWLLFVVSCRRGIKHDYDIVFGPVADDQIYTSIMLFETGVLNVEETIARLAVREFYNQISFHSEQVLRELKFVKSEIIG